MSLSWESLLTLLFYRVYYVFYCCGCAWVCVCVRIGRFQSKDVCVKPHPYVCEPTPTRTEQHRASQRIRLFVVVELPFLCALSFVVFIVFIWFSVATVLLRITATVSYVSFRIEPAGANSGLRFCQAHMFSLFLSVVAAFRVGPVRL